MRHIQPKPNDSHPARDREATEARILDAARDVFAKRGYDGAGLREVANAAQANLSLISRYFGGKEGLLSALTQRFIAQRREGTLSYPPQKTLADEVYCYLHDRLKDDLTNEAMVRLIISRAAIDPEFRKQTMHNMDAQADANFRLRVDQLVERGDVPEGTDIDLLFASVIHFSFSVNFFGAMIKWRTDAEIDALFRAFADAIGQD